MGVRVTPAEFQAKHAKRLKAAIPELKDGVMRVTESPGVKAAAKKDKWVARMTEAEVQDKWARRTAAVPLAEWKTAMIEKGANRISAGIDGASRKVIAFASELLPYEDGVIAEVADMPDVTLEDSIARASHWIRRMAEFKRTS